MILTEFDEKLYRESLREEGRSEGIEEGRMGMLKETLTKMMKKGLSSKEVAELLDIDPKTIEKILNEAD